MPEYLAPGVYVEEVSSGIKPIEGVSTSTAAFLGPTERGPLLPTLVASFAEFQRVFGGFLGEKASFLPYAVKGFFDNGGKRAFIARVVRLNPPGVANFAATPAEGQIIGNDGAGAALDVAAVGEGAWGNGLRLMLRRGTMDDSQKRVDERLYRITIAYYRDRASAEALDDPENSKVKNPLAGRADLAADERVVAPDVIEDYDNLVLADGSGNSFAKVVNGSSNLVRVKWKDDNRVFSEGAVREPGHEEPGQERQKNTRWIKLKGAGSDGMKDGVNAVAGATDYTITDYTGRAAAKIGDFATGLRGIELVDEVSLLIAPDDVRVDELPAELIIHCESLRDRFAIIAAKDDLLLKPALDWRPIQDTSYAAFYVPWITINDPVTNGRLAVPAAGHIAGIFARTDIERGVHKAPANEVVRGAIDMAMPVTKGLQDILNPRGVNCVRDFRADGRGIRLWGARTMSSDPEWKYINVRRLFLFLEESIDQGTQWVVFEPNSDPTWAAVRRNISNFLITVWRSGALMGNTPDEAFFVKCDRTTMTQDDIDNGRLICLIGVAPVKPAEFVIFRISQKTAEAQA